MPFATLQWQLFCMPGSYGARHALSAWGDCDPNTYKYHMGAPEELKSKKESLQAISTQAGLHNDMSGHGWGFKQGTLVAPPSLRP
mmetsp:Transcript_51005/g.106540  ORF Transcript_51005/g.106540 Transcript_51005/m.106540 type:complete len:85 (-) Transcript_51005:344-598(-)